MHIKLYPCRAFANGISGIAVAALFLASAAGAQTSGEKVHFTFAISDLYAPFLNPEENKKVAEGVMRETNLSATYKHRASKFTWTKNMSGVTGLFAPGSRDTSTTQTLALTLRPEEGEPGTLGVDLPKVLAGNYVLDSLFFTLPPDVVYQQPGYRKIVDKLSDPEKDPQPKLPAPAFEYWVSFDPGNQVEQQSCLFISTPFGFPDTAIPVVTQVKTSDKQIYLHQRMGKYCPFVNERNPESPDYTPGKLPPLRIAAAQASPDYTVTKGKISRWGLLPVTTGMTRWYHRNSEGAFASVTGYGPFERFAVRLRGDTQYPVKDTLLVRTETWDFFNHALIKYTSDINFFSTQQRAAPTIRQVIYFHDGKRVGGEQKTENCEAAECKKIAADVARQMARPFAELLQEVKDYRTLTLIPVE